MENNTAGISNEWNNYESITISITEDGIYKVLGRIRKSDESYPYKSWFDLEGIWLEVE